jgi:hypothetical protein
MVAALIGSATPRLAVAQREDSTATRQLGPGVSHTRSVRIAGPWIINVVRIDLRHADLAVRHVRAREALSGRERVTEMVKRVEASGQTVLAAVNADFFDLRSGANENNQVIDGEWWKGVRVTDSPFDTFDNVHAQFALDSLRRPLLDRFSFDGWARSSNRAIPIISLNANPSGTPEGSALYTSRFGTAAPLDTTRQTAEVALVLTGRRGDTLTYVRRGAAAATSGNAIPVDGALLAGYGARAREVAALADGDTVRVTLGVTPRLARQKRMAPLALIIGGWPRNLRDGVNIAGNAASEEGTISRNAEVRHPRTAVGFSRDSSTLFLVTVDGRSEKSAGMTLTELADAMRDLGAWQALNFDGGGSTTMVVQGAIVNSPADTAGEREVGNALMVVRPSPRSR